MSDIDKTLSAFIDAWNRGERPKVGDYLERAAEGSERDELANQIESWLEHAPTPAYDPPARRAIRSEPSVAALLGAADEEAGLWPAVLPRLRRRAGWSIDDLADRLAAQLGLGEEQRPKAAAYLDQLEQGALDPQRVSRRLLAVLGALLGASAATLRDAAQFGAAMRPAPATGAPLFRSDMPADTELADDIAAISAAALRPASPAQDEVDRLFTGGPDA
jgi:transcriptional regulator with XRE-family HTH domain